MNKFSLEYQWKQYLDIVNLKEELMSDVQLRETKRAFIGGIGQFIILLPDILSQLNNKVDVLKDMTQEINNFWFKETNKLN